MNRNQQRGFSLIEVLVAMGLLATIMVGTITALSSQTKMRNKLQNRERTAHLVSVAMSRLHDDFRNAYFAPTAIRGRQSSALKTTFVWKPSQKVHYFTTHSFRSFTYGSPESSMAQVKYEVRENAKDPTKQELVRYIDTNLAAPIAQGEVGKEQVIVDELVKFEVLFWNGEAFVPEWDLESPDFGNKLPKMARIFIEAKMPMDPLEVDARLAAGLPGTPENRETYKLETMVFLLNTSKIEDLKKPSAEGYKWQ